MYSQFMMHGRKNIKLNRSLVKTVSRFSLNSINIITHMKSVNSISLVKTIIELSVIKSECYVGR